jgi:hypothetical protein
MHRVASPDTSDTALERQLQRTSVAPRVTLADLEANISAEFYGTGHDLASSESAVRIRHDDLSAEDKMRLLTLCVLVLKRTADRQARSVEGKNEA